MASKFEVKSNIYSNVSNFIHFIRISKIRFQLSNLENEFAVGLVIAATSLYSATGGCVQMASFSLNIFPAK